MCSGKENPDSDADLDVDGDDTLEYGKPQYPWVSVGKVGLTGQAIGNKKSSFPRVRGSTLAMGNPEHLALMAYNKLGSIVLDHCARYTEADVIPCTGEEPGEAKEREALRGAVLKQVWAQAWHGGVVG